MPLLTHTLNTYETTYALNQSICFLYYRNHKRICWRPSMKIRKCLLISCRYLEDIPEHSGNITTKYTSKVPKFLLRRCETSLVVFKEISLNTTSLVSHLYICFLLIVSKLVHDLKMAEHGRNM